MLTLVAWETDRLSAGTATGVRTCPRCHASGRWSAVRERRRLRLLGTGVGGWASSDLVACRVCGCALPAGWRDAQREHAAHPAPN